MTDKGGKTSRAQFATKLGVIATTVGSAVGLGNIWRFPYEIGTHGGGAFLVCYLFFIFVIGVPLICSEFSIGRSARKGITGAFREVSGSRWMGKIGFIGVLTALLIMGFYSVVSGWTMEYLFQSVAGGLKYSTQAEYAAQFDSFSSGAFRPLFWTLLFIAINYFVLVRGVEKGIEKVSNIMMPLLLLILIVFSVHSLMMPGAWEGVKFMFKPDFSKINSSVVLGAMGQAFFSLSIGMGSMITYASYFSADTKLGRTTLVIAVCDTLVAILSGLIIFPAVFSYGGTPAAGPTLVFEVLPTIFHRIPGGMIWSALFFLLLFIAALTSAISMSEIGISYLCDEFGMSRKKATLVAQGAIAVLSVLCAFSFGPLADFKIFGMTVFDLFDYVTASILMPVCGLLVAILGGWLSRKGFLADELTNGGGLRGRGVSLVQLSLRWICPTAIVLVFLHSMGVI